MVFWNPLQVRIFVCRDHNVSPYIQCLLSFIYVAEIKTNLIVKPKYLVTMMQKLYSVPKEFMRLHQQILSDGSRVNFPPLH